MPDTLNSLFYVATLAGPLALSAAAGLTLADTAPFILAANAFGILVGLCGVAARSLGGWFSGRPDCLAAGTQFTNAWSP